MKKVLLFTFLALGSQLINAQILNPVQWSFTSKKIDDKTYELHLTATIQPGWHLYSQSQPADAVVIPTTFKFNPNPLVRLDGKSKEVGKMELMRDKKLGISANQYAGKVDFVQRVKRKGTAKTNFSGSVEFQTCDDKKCLPPKTVTFNITL